MRQPVIPGYHILRDLKPGGQAFVYLAVQRSTGRKVALKVMRDGPLANASSRARFDREVQILAALSHPHIVTVLDRGVSADGCQFFAMNYVDGRSLDEFLSDLQAREHPFRAPGNRDEALPLFMQICDAVNAAHMRGVVHRDLKPSNIRLDEQGEPHVLDFGLARAPLERYRLAPPNRSPSLGSSSAHSPGRAPSKRKGTRSGSTHARTFIRWALSFTKC